MKWQAIKLDFVRDNSRGYFVVSYQNERGKIMKKKEALRACESSMRGLIGWQEVKLDLLRQLRERYGYKATITQSLHKKLEESAKNIIREEFILQRNEYLRLCKGDCDPGSQKWLKEKLHEDVETEEMELIRATW